MEKEELLVCKAMYRYLDITPGKTGTQFGGKYVGVTSCNHYLATVLSVKAAQGILITWNVLNLIYKKIVPAILRQTACGIIVKFIGCCYIAELIEFFANIQYGCRIFVRFKPGLQLFQHIALAYSSLAYEHEYHPAVQQ